MKFRPVKHKRIRPSFFEKSVSVEKVYLTPPLSRKLLCEPGAYEWGDWDEGCTRFPPGLSLCARWSGCDFKAAR